CALSEREGFLCGGRDAGGVAEFDAEEARLEHFEEVLEADEGRESERAAQGEAKEILPRARTEQRTEALLELFNACVVGEGELGRVPADASGAARHHFGH